MSGLCRTCGTTMEDLPGDEDLLPAAVASGDITPGTPKTLIDETTAADKIRYLASVQLTCRQPGKVEVIYTPSGGPAKTIASGRTGVGAKLNFDFNWFPFVQVKEGGNVKVVFTIHTWAAASDVEAYLQTSLADEGSGVQC